MWKIWPYLPDYGRRAAQFVDLLGYFSIKCESSAEEVSFISQWNRLQFLISQNGIRGIGHKSFNTTARVKSRFVHVVKIGLQIMF